MVEEFFQGYCKKHNSTQIICCEYSVDADGYYCLDQVDCDFGQCPYSGECTVIKKALEKEDEEPA